MFNLLKRFHQWNIDRKQADLNKEYELYGYSDELLEKQVKFLGQRNDVNELMQAMDIFLLPSLYEGLPVVGVEAQTSGLLCILSSSMTKETKVLETTTFISLDKSSKNLFITSLKISSLSK